MLHADSELLLSIIKLPHLQASTHLMPWTQPHGTEG
jgi:hypothetical protein